MRELWRPRLCCHSGEDEERWGEGCSKGRTGVVAVRTVERREDTPQDTSEGAGTLVLHNTAAHKVATSGRGPLGPI